MNATVRKPIISLVSPCFNEQENVELLVARVRAVFEGLPHLDFEHIFIDNHSTDATVPKLKALAALDKRIKLIVNARNFGHIRSPYHAFLQAQGDAVVMMASDLQDPPEMLPDFIQKWEEGYKVVVGVKASSRESRLMWLIRKAYYRLLFRIADIQVVQNFTGFGLYDQRVVGIMRQLGDPYPYFRGIISEIGFDRAEILYEQPQRHRGITKNNFYTLYDMAMLGITSHSKLPIRLATMGGFALAFCSLLVSIAYLALKLLFWSRFGFGLAPVLIGLFFFSSVQLFFIGLLGEYVATIHTQVMNRPHVVEQERVNFDD